MGLHFGTAGLRAPMGPGPDRLNVETVARCAHGLVSAALAVERESLNAGVVIGHDARIDSDRFAAIVARVVAAAGAPVYALAGPVPTPLVSFAVRSRSFGLGVMVTASHNPPVYNGLKVFGSGGAQIVPPFDARVEAEIERAPASVPSVEPSLRTIDLDDSYLDALAACRRQTGALGVRAVYSALHGVGSALFGRLAERHGLELIPVEEQAVPDGRFPTVDLPNPEEPTALARALELGRERSAELVLVHDPDADRLAVAVAHDGGLVTLTGDQIGVLLADHLLASRPEGAVVFSTVVSSRMIERLASARGARSVRTRTGFKWMARAAAALPGAERAVLAYEQALGFSVADVVRDKDGLGAALAIAEAARAQRDRGRTLVDRWAELEAELGPHRTASATRTWAPGEEARAREAFAAYRASPPLALDGLGAAERTDFCDPAAVTDGGPPFDLVMETFADGSWVAVRPSGTEPKLKVYVEAREPPGADAAARAAARAEALRRAAAARIEEEGP